MKLGKKIISMVLVMVMALGIIPIMPASVSATPDGWEVDKWAAAQTEPPKSLEPGQVWTGKDVTYNNDGKTFTITLSAWAAEYSDKDNSNQATSPLDDASTDIIISDKLGEQFEYNEDANYSVGGFNFNATDGKITWTVSQDAILSGIEKCTFTVSLKEDGLVDGETYYTNDGASAVFEPKEGNTYYWTRETISDKYEISNVSFNDRGINSVTITDSEYKDKNNNFLKIVIDSGNMKVGDTRDFVFDSQGYKIKLVEINILNPSQTINGKKYLKEYILEIANFPIIGVTQRYTVYTESDTGGNDKNTMPFEKRTRYTDWQKIIGGKFAWNGAKIETDLPNKGEITLKQNKYTVTYKDGADGRVFTDAVYENLTYNQDTPEHSDPERTGWTFEGWDPTVADKVIGDVTYTATWKQNKYTVTYNKGDHGTFDDQVTDNLVYGVPTPVAPATPGDNGWTFAGWNPEVANTVTGDVTYVAQWTQDKYTVTYAPGDHGTFTAESTDDLVYNDDTPAFVSTTTGELGYKFTGWDVDPIPEKVTGTVTYTAQWEQIKYTVTYEPGTHGTFEPQINPDLVYGDDTPAFAGATTGEDGWTFAGWDVDPIPDKVTDTVTYTATWSQDEYTVKYIKGAHGDFDPQVTPNLNYGDPTPEFVGEPKGKTGWLFNGWDPMVEITVTGDAEYEAQWVPEEYTVIYRPGTQGTFSEQTTSGLHHNDDTPAFTGTPAGNNGWTFTGWSPAVEGKVTGDAEYIAQWKQNVYTVTYAPGGQGTFTAQVTSNLNYGNPTPAAPAATPGNPGWTFTGWSPEPSATVTGNAAYVAQWEQIKYTVTYEPGTQGTFAEQVHGNLTYNVNTPTFAGAKTGKPGYTFTVWSPEVEEKVTGNATYTAQWSQIKYTVTYEPGTQGTFTAQVHDGLVHDENTPAFTGTPTGNTGWKFDGWTPAIADKVTGNAIYTAKWAMDEIEEEIEEEIEINEYAYTIHYFYGDLEDISAKVEGKAELGSEIAYTAKPKEGFVFSMASPNGGTLAITAGENVINVYYTPYVPNGIVIPETQTRNHTVRVNYINDETGASMNITYNEIIVAEGASWDAGTFTTMQFVGFEIVRIEGDPVVGSDIQRNQIINVYYAPIMVPAPEIEQPKALVPQSNTDKNTTEPASELDSEKDETEDEITATEPTDSDADTEWEVSEETIEEEAIEEEIIEAPVPLARVETADEPPALAMPERAMLDHVAPTEKAIEVIIEAEVIEVIEEALPLGDFPADENKENPQTGDALAILMTTIMMLTGAGAAIFARRRIIK